VRVERRPVHHRVATAAHPGRVAAAVPKARLMPHEDLAGAERVAVGASRRRVGDPLPGRGLYQLTQHVTELRTVADDRPDSRYQNAKNALRLILWFGGYELQVTAEAAAKFPCLTGGSGGEVSMGDASWGGETRRRLQL
jgi:hypothetical protein